MDSTLSVSKGVFLFKNGFNKKTKSSKKGSQTLFQKWFKPEPWYSTYRDNWDYIENEIQELNNKTYSLLQNDIVAYIKSFYTGDTPVQDGIVPSATLLTGVNQPDHVSQFDTLMNQIRQDVTPHIAIIHSQDAPSVKHLVENTVWQLIKGHDNLDLSNSDNEDNIQNEIKLRKSQCTISCLQKWYETKYAKPKATTPTKKKKLTHERKSLVIIIADFESFNCNVLQDLVMIVSSHVPSLPVVFVFGVATSVSALHKSFPYHVSSKLLIKVFYSHSSPVYMNQVLENIFLTHTSPFHLSGKAFQLMTDVFLFYDFSVSGLIQSIKYCMMDHYYGDNVKSLCCPREQLNQAISNLSADDLESIRQLPSFRPFLESQDCKTKISLFENDEFLKESLCEELNNLHDYLFSFYGCLRVLYVFVKDLPKNILGKTIREMYTICATEDITKTQGFRECIQLLSFQSQVKLVDTLKSAIKTINSLLPADSIIEPFQTSPTKHNISNDNIVDVDQSFGVSFMKNVRVCFLTFVRQIKRANTEVITPNNIERNEGDMEEDITPGNRYKLKEKLRKATRVSRIESAYEMVRSRFLSYLEEVFAKGLQPPASQPFHEIFFFNDVQNVRKQIIGSPRGAVHTALSNPVHYLQCSCCRLPSADSVAASLPDVCVVYKLHRECGKHVNLYDWLQAAAAVLQPPPEDDDADRREIDPAIQLRFTRAVSELQFLGFIKSSKRKTDHVMRLTW